MIRSIRKIRNTVASAATSALVATALIAATVSHSAAQDKPIKIGFPNQTEQAILGYMAALIVEKKLGLEVELAPNLGGTAIGQQAIVSGALDIYPDYTGDALSNVLKEDPITDPAKAYERVAQQYKEKYNITWLAPTKFNNTYALALKKAKADELKIATISDLKDHAADWTLGSSVEFAGRPLDGYPGMAKAYGFKFGTIKPMDIGLMYTSIDAGQVDVIVAFATDARIEKLGLKVVDDDKYFFPAYNGAITVRDEVLKAHPEIAEAINSVIGNLDNETQTKLNARADIDNIPLDKVAEDYLKEIGVLK
jgi:glycine betaine/choline ABC-type transport system substrate-binding protein